MVEIKINIGKALKNLEGLRIHLSRPQQTGLWRFLKLLFKSWIGATFEKSGARRGHARWKPLSPEYLAWKTSRHVGRRGNTYGPYASKPLIKTGHLQSNFKVLNQSEKRLSFGTQVPYAQYHQEGGERGRPPQREIVFVTNKDRDDISGVVRKWVIKGLKK